MAKAKTSRAKSKKKSNNRPRPRALQVAPIKRKKSIVWNYFRSLPYDARGPRAMCTLCDLVLRNSGGSTTSMRGHLLRKHADVVTRPTEISVVLGTWKRKRPNFNNSANLNLNLINVNSMSQPQHQHQQAPAGLAQAHTSVSFEDVKLFQGYQGNDVKANLNLNLINVNSAPAQAQASVSLEDVKLFQVKQELDLDQPREVGGYHPLPHPQNDVGAAAAEATGRDLEGMTTPPPPPPPPLPQLYPAFQQGEGFSSLGPRQQGPPPLKGRPEVEEATKHILHYVISCLQPLRSVDDPMFIALIASLNPQYLHLATGGDPSKGLSRFILPLLDRTYLSLKDTIRSMLQGTPISLSVEVWGTSKSRSFLAVTANFLSEDFRAKSKLLGVRRLQVQVQGQESVSESEVISALLQEYDVSPAQVQTVFVNSELEMKQQQILEKETYPCLAGTLRRAYDVLSRKLELLKNWSIRNWEELAESRLPKYKQVRGHPGNLMQTLLGYLENMGGREIDSDLDQLRAFVSIQKGLNVITSCLLEGRITASTIGPILYAMGDLLEEGCLGALHLDFDENDTAEVREELMAFIQGSYGFDLVSAEMGRGSLALASFLDPRYKVLKFFDGGQRKEVISRLGEMLRSGEGQGPEPESAEVSFNQSLNSEEDSQKPEVIRSRFIDVLEKANVLTREGRMRMRSHPGSGSKEEEEAAAEEEMSVEDELELELKRYDAEPVTAGVVVEPLQWWRENGDRFPRLKTVARRFLGMGGNATQPQLVFTMEGERLREAITDIEEEHLEKIMCYRSWLAKEAEAETDANASFNYFEEEEVNADDTDADGPTVETVAGGAMSQCQDC